jgi:ureidoglycolate lyase
MKLKIEELAPQAFARFGKVIEKPSRQPDASGSGWSWWGENQLLAGGDRPYALGYLDLIPAGLSFDWAERHLLTDELLIPVSGDCLVYAGPPENLNEPAKLPALESFRVFRVRQGQAALLEKGVWHGAPLAHGKPAQVIVLLLQHSAKQDGYVVHFPETPVTIEA